MFGCCAPFVPRPGASLRGVEGSGLSYDVRGENMRWRVCEGSGLAVVVFWLAVVVFWLAVVVFWLAVAVFSLAVVAFWLAVLAMAALTLQTM